VHFSEAKRRTIFNLAADFIHALFSDTLVETDHDRLFSVQIKIIPHKTPAYFDSPSKMY